MEKCYILMLDDNQEDYLIVRKMLSSLECRNYVIDWVATVEEGLAAIEKQTYNTFLVGYRFGAVEDGLDFIRKAIQKGHNEPFILLSGTDHPDLDIEAQSAGAADYIVKNGLRANELDRSIRYALLTADCLQKSKLLNEELAAKVATHAAILEQLFANFALGSLAIVDREIRYVLAGGKIYENLNGQTQDVIGLPFFANSSLKEDTQKSLLSLFSRVFDGETVQDYEMPEEIGGKNYAIHAFPLYYPNSSVDHIAIVTHDITDAKQHAQGLMAALKKEKDLNELKTSFVSLASHEFRTPLTTIKSSAALIASFLERQDFEKVKKHSSRIQSVVGNLNDVLEEFLSLGKLEDGREEVHFVPFGLPQFVHETLAELKHLLKSGQVFKYTHNGDNIAKLDVSLMKNVLINLLSNAIKYSMEDTMIQIETKVDNGSTDIRVIDHGIGISPDDQKNLFSRFFRGSNVGTIKGTGLGLYIVRHQVELMRGQIFCESIPGKGSSFLMKFN